MGRTIPSITQTWLAEEAALNRFKRALRESDQRILDELLVMSRQHLAEASYASDLYPLDAYILSILIEIYKQFKLLQDGQPMVMVSQPSLLMDLITAHTPSQPILPEPEPEPSTTLLEPKYIPFED